MPEPRKRNKKEKDDEPAEKRGRIEEQTDHVALLPEDCLLDVFSRLDQLDLDEIAPLSGTLCRLSEFSRKQATRIKMLTLIVEENESGQIRFVVKFWKDEQVSLETANDASGLFQKQSRNEQSQPHPDKQQISAIIDRAATQLSRFAFEFCSFISVCINKHFIGLLEKIGSCSSLTNYDFKDLKFDNDLSIEEKQRFAASLLIAKPESISIECACDASFIEENFLIAYTQAVSNPSLIVNGTNESKRLDASARFSTILGEYQHLEMPTLVVNTDALMPQLIKRLRSKRSGVWRFYITRDIEIMDEIETEPAVEYSHHAFGILHIDNGSHNVNIRTDVDSWNPELFMLLAQFTESAKCSVS